jgi:phosphatidylserine/phosphatidylglycerophosphate/cardiolipin synthase-like enzyme
MRCPALLLVLATCAAGPAPVELVLHAPGDRAGPSPACTIRLCTSLRDLIDRATTRIDFAIYGVRDMPEIVAALQRAQARGVAIRGVVDRRLDGTSEYDGTDALVALLGTVHDDLAVDRATAARHPGIGAYGGATCGLPPPPGHAGPRSCFGFDLGDRCLLGLAAAPDALVFDGDILHDKFFVVDDRTVWTGSTNVSDSCAGGYNANLVLVLDDPEVARWYTAEFEQMYGGALHGEKRPVGLKRARLADGTEVEVLFSPQDHAVDRGLRPVLQAARRRIDVAAFFLTHTGVAADLVAAARRGVQVRVLVDATGASNAYSKHAALRLAGVPVKVEPWGGKLHVKAVAVDGEVLVAGSMNFTSAGDASNDENTLVLRSPRLASQFHAWFEAVWADVPERWLHEDPFPESLDSGHACHDHVDNDHDGRIDAADPDCGPSPPPRAPDAVLRLVPKSPEQPLVRAWTDADGHRRYAIPGQDGWSTAHADELFCSRADAEAAGYRKARSTDR